MKKKKVLWGSRINGVWNIFVDESLATIKLAEDAFIEDELKRLQDDEFMENFKIRYKKAKLLKSLIN